VAYTQDGRRLVVKTPLGKDDLLLNGFGGQEAISRLFSFRLECVAENTKKIPFDALLGQSITVEVTLPGNSKRYFNGICRRVAQGARDAVFTKHLLDVVPKFWLLSKKKQSRIFQHMSVPDILKKVLADLDVKYELQGVFQPRDFCVQYRESDFDFASRLMEEEGIYYFFKHSSGAHQMVVANSPGSHADLPGKSSLIFEGVGGGSREEDRITAWEKSQELCSGKVTLWDFCFELPHKHLEAETFIQASVAAGKSSHKLKVANNDKLELYDYPGAYAQRFDGINKGGGEQTAELSKIFDDNVRTAEIRMQEQAAASVLVHGVSNVRHLVSGHKFTLERHFDGDGPWVLHEIEHAASEAADVRSGNGGFTYQNRFSCFPAALPFRPPRVTPKPTIVGTQTAVVVGPPGEEIFCDKYGRVKVQFHWDREGKKNVDSSCWIRVAQPWAGKRWGAFFWPRIGNEVVVTFEEGDPDRPLIVGSVYNFDNMPPFVLPFKNEYAGIKSASLRGLAHENFNAIVLVDQKGHEHLAIHSERNMTFKSEFDKTFVAGRHKGERVSGASVFTVGGLPGGGK
jgi:type VI secretion system secreted protein VgrG